MKRIIFYIALLIQILTVSLLAWQYHLIDDHGKSIKLLVEDREYYYYDIKDYQGTVYVEYKINKIASNNWDIPESVKNNEIIYVILEENKNGIYEVVETSMKKPSANANQVVLTGRYLYHDMGNYYVNYGGLGQIKNKELFQTIDVRKPFLVTVKVAPWGQTKVVAMENVSK